MALDVEMHESKQSGIPTMRPKERKFLLAGWMISLAIHLVVGASLLVFARNEVMSALAPRKTPEATVEKPAELLLAEPMVENLQVESPKDKAAPTELTLPAPMTLPRTELAAAQTELNPAGNAIAGGIFSEGSFVVPAVTATSEFCGSTGDESYISYVVDCSGSMVLALDYVRRELTRSISSLGANQYFQIIVYADGPPQEWPSDKLLRAHAGNRAAALDFLKTLGLTKVATSQSGAQALADALQKAFAARASDGHGCDLIYLLTDGEYDHPTITRHIQQLQSSRRSPVTFNVIACGNNDNASFLKNLATRYDGQYVFVSDDQMALALKGTP